MNIIFDFDGTLADSLKEAVAVYNSLGGHPKTHITPKLLENFRHMSPLEAIAAAKVPLWRLPWLVKIGRAAMSRKIYSVELFEGVVEIIKDLAKDHRLFMVTSNSDIVVEKYLSDRNLHQYFEYIHGDIGVFGKAKALKCLIRDFSLIAINTIYIGDEVRDIEGAHKAGLKIISVSWGYNAEDILLKHNPDYLISKIDEIKPLIRSFL